MTCEEMFQSINDVIDNESAMSLYKEFSEHLQGCNPCQLVIDNIRKTIRLYQAGEPYPMPEAFQERFREALKAKWKAKFPHAVV
ncbi:MAG: hypothetical protein U0798_09885 [Gemmataceae bacterium]